MRTTILFLFAFCLLFVSCDKDDDPIVEPPAKINPTNEFIKKVMDDVYLWEDKIPNVDISENNKPQDLFEEICYREVDKWSFLTDDFNKTLDMFKGISTSFGSVLSLGRFSGTNDIFAIVLYVYKDSPADKAGMKRGDIIIKIDGKVPTTSNYQVEFGKQSYTVTLGKLVENSDGSKAIGDSGITMSMTRKEIDEHPVIHKEVLEGTQVGYLMYDAFINRFDEDLKQVFADFKEQNVNELILDLRYNSGGDDVSATLLASLIAPNSAVGKYFFKSVYNEGFTKYYQEHPDVAQKNHADGMKFEDYAEGLDLDRVFILTTDGSASASELVINGLIPVMNVCVVGDTTHGKCTGMTGFGDDLENPENSQWGVFPVIVKAANSAGTTDYFNGLVPDVLVDEYLPYLPFGNVNDPLVAAALAKITGQPVGVSRLKTTKMKFKEIGIIGGKPEICKNLLIH